MPASTPLSEKISKELKRRGFSFVGPVTMYALMQSVGILINASVRSKQFPDLNTRASNACPSSGSTFNKNNTGTALHAHRLIEEFIDDRRKFLAGFAGYALNFFTCFFLYPDAFLNRWHSLYLQWVTSYDNILHIIL